ncbi:MAG: redoxin domain-containing protein [Blastocatellia bacterium]
MWKVLTALVQATILFLSISASAQTTPDAQGILKKVNETYRNLKSYQFEYKTVSDSKTERAGLTSTTHNESLSRITAVRLNFWATWCGPYVAEMPHLEKLHREYKNKGVIILGIDDEEAEVAQDYLKRHGYTFNTLIDAEKQVSKLYRINAIPQSFFITKDGKIAAYNRGTRRESELRDGIEKALAGKIADPTLKAASVQAEPKLDPAALPAPKLVSPEHLSHFDHYPRTTVLVWEAVPGAAGYRVETDFKYRGIWANEDRGDAHVVEVKETSYKFNFVGAQPGRWRVWTFDARGREGAKSEWREFVYSR